MDKSRYKIFQIPGRNGKVRTIEAPDPELMKLQKGILLWLQDFGIKQTPYAHGSVRGRSIKTNALPHVGNQVVMKFDLKNFFPNITAKDIQRILYIEDVDSEMSAYIVDQCTLDGRLPQGAPTSPFLANIVAKRLDFVIAKFLRNREQGLSRETRPDSDTPFYSYTRYVDDMTISGNDPHLNQLRAPIEYLISGRGFTVNHKKTRILRAGRKCIAGVVVNEQLSTPRPMRKKLRAIFHQIKIQLLAIQEEPPQELKDRYKSALGLLAHITGINPSQGRAYLKICSEINLLLTLKPSAISALS